MTWEEIISNLEAHERTLSKEEAEKFHHHIEDAKRARDQKVAIHESKDGWVAVIGRRSVRHIPPGDAKP